MVLSLAFIIRADRTRYGRLIENYETTSPKVSIATPGRALMPSASSPNKEDERNFLRVVGSNDRVAFATRHRKRWRGGGTSRGAFPNIGMTHNTGTTQQTSGSSKHPRVQGRLAHGEQEVPLKIQSLQGWGVGDGSPTCVIEGSARIVVVCVPCVNRRWLIIIDCQPAHLSFRSLRDWRRHHGSPLNDSLICQVLPKHSLCRCPLSSSRQPPPLDWVQGSYDFPGSSCSSPASTCLAHLRDHIIVGQQHSFVRQHSCIFGVSSMPPASPSRVQQFILVFFIIIDLVGLG